MQTKRVVSLMLAGLSAGAVLTGCGAGPAATPAVVRGVAIGGKVYGGQQPVVGARIQLYAANLTGGYGSSATALIAANVVTGAGGSFNVTGDYTCPAASSQVYLLATGGNAGYTTNANLALMAGLGNCGDLATATYVNINEVSTVGTVWALAPFMAGPAKVGTTAGNVSGLSNAFADINVLVNTASGTATGTAAPAGATMPVSEINTLANILAACVNSSGGAMGDGSTCGTLFGAANPGGTSATAPTDTVTAALNIAQHPALNVATLYTLPAAAAPFQPTLTAKPNDFTLAVNFTGGGLNAPSALTADSSGNVWVANGGGNTVTKLAHSGAVLSGTGGYTASLSAPSAIAIDASNTVWVTNAGNNTVSRLTGAGAVYAGSPYTGGGLNGPVSIAFDALGTAWIANSAGSSVSTIDTTGNTRATYTPAAVASPLAVGVTPH